MEYEKNNKRVNFRLPDGLLWDIDQRARALGVSRSDVLRMALINGIGSIDAPLGRLRAVDKGTARAQIEQAR